MKNVHSFRPTFPQLPFGCWLVPDTLYHVDERRAEQKPGQQAALWGLVWDSIQGRSPSALFLSHSHDTHEGLPVTKRNGIPMPQEAAVKKQPIWNPLVKPLSVWEINPDSTPLKLQSRLELLTAPTALTLAFFNHWIAVWPSWGFMGNNRDRERKWEGRKGQLFYNTNVTDSLDIFVWILLWILAWGCFRFVMESQKGLKFLHLKMCV